MSCLEVVSVPQYDRGCFLDNVYAVVGTNESARDGRKILHEIIIGNTRSHSSERLEKPVSRSSDEYNRDGLFGLLQTNGLQILS